MRLKVLCIAAWFRKPSQFFCGKWQANAASGSWCSVWMMWFTTTGPVAKELWPDGSGATPTCGSCSTMARKSQGPRRLSTKASGGGQTYNKNRRDQTGGSEYGATVVARPGVQTRVVVRRSGEDAHGYECLCWDNIEHQWLSCTKNIAKEHALSSVFSVFRSYVIQIEYNILAYF